MTLASLKQTVGTMLEHADTSAFVSNGVDLLLVGVNNAKNWAQSRYDFEYARTTVQLTVNATTGGSLDTCVEVGTLRTVNVKKVEAGFVSYQGTINRPCRFSSKKGQVADAARRYEGLPYAPSIASPLEAGSGGVATSLPMLVQQNRTIFLYPNSSSLYPTGSTTIYLDVIEWLPDYVDIGSVVVTGSTAADGTYLYKGGVINNKSWWVLLAGKVLWYNSSANAWWITALVDLANTSATARWALASTSVSPVGTYTAAGAFSGAPVVAAATVIAPSDFLLTYGAEFLMWKTIVEGNHLWEAFVNRTEGKLAPPEKMAAAAWQILVDWDSGLVATNTSEFDLE